VPQTTITVPGFFKSPADLNLYVNGLYNIMLPGGNYSDFSSDNVTIRLGTEPYASKLPGTMSIDNISGWDDWENLRSINLILNNLQDVTGNAADINHYVGIARYLRAIFYIDKIKTYSDVPWYGKVIEPNDEDALLKPQDFRALVVDSLMADLEFAAANIKPEMGNKTWVHKYVALAELSRFCLYEGTYRKYHSELGLTSVANRFLQRAVTASEEIINSGLFDITGAGTNVELMPGIAGSDGFRALFSSKNNLDANKEIIQWAEYGRTPYDRRHRADDIMVSSTNNYSLSRSLQESFLTKDGKPFSSVVGYATKEYKDVFIDRDPRMAETFAYPGIYEENPVTGMKYYHANSPGRGGYDQCKYFYKYQDPDAKTDNNLGQFTALPIFRYAEILLNYAEAKMESGIGFSADDAAKTVNKLRSRVGMPDFNADTEVDDDLKALYPDINDNVILALRRERRVELACEGLRQDDIYRWGAGKLFEHPSSKQGIYIPGVPYVYDVTGDGIPDRGIAENSASRTGDAVTWYDLNDPGLFFYLENDTFGYVRNVQDNERKFEEPKYYYDPIPKAQIVLNPNLRQPYGW
jgi:hypothetical protein